MEQQVEEMQRRMSDAVKNMLTTLEKDGLRQLQSDVFKCSVKCCDDSTIPVDQLNSCVESCGQQLRRTQEHIESELNNFQSRFQRCAMSCQDLMRDEGASVASGDFASQQKLVDCLKRCTDDHVQLVPKMGKRLSQVVQDAKKHKSKF